MTAYYNEIDPFAAQWLRNLIAAGHIAPGDVDERSITEVKPDELKQYTQCHFFAGIGVWSYALRQAMWPDTRPVWTGSCPCQPFSAAGKGEGVADERHLWPAWYELVSECKPAIIFGEQVASNAVIGKSDGTGENVWIDIVQADMERAFYTFAPFDLPAAGFGAPHVRQRVWFVSERIVDGMGNACGESSERNTGELSEAQGGAGSQGSADGNHDHRHPNAGEVVRVGDANNERHERQVRERSASKEKSPHGHASERGFSYRPSEVYGFWASSDWLGCRDGKFRPVEPGTSPLANGATQRVGRLRAYGNAINAEVAKGFITAYLAR